MSIYTEGKGKYKKRYVCPNCRKLHTYYTLKFGHKRCKAKGATA